MRDSISAEKPRLARRSSFTRLASVIAITAGLGVATLYAITHYVVSRHARQVLLQSVDSDLAGLVDIYASSGQGELVKRMTDRVALSPSARDQELYLLSNAAGQFIAGNIESWPLLSAENSETGFISGLNGQRSLARATQIGPDLKLVVGRSFARTQTLQRKIATAFASGGAIVVILSVFLGLWFARQSRARIDAINHVFRLVGAGTLEARNPIANRQDEIEELATHTNRMLDRIVGLIADHRHVTDHTAHEIRTPLMHLDTRILAVLKENQDPKLAKELGHARQHIRYIVAMLESLLDIAANEAHKGSLIGLEPLDFSALTQNVVDLFSDSAEDMGVRFDVNIEAGISLRGERMQLTRLLSNLLDNAFKYCGQNGHVALSLKDGPVLKVSDSGPGIPEDNRERIFNRFERVHRHSQNAAKKGSVRVGGHGLGLALARAIAERHALTLTCIEGETGAVFVLRRP